jgi:hypothetical protein
MARSRKKKLIRQANELEDKISWDMNLACWSCSASRMAELSLVNLLTAAAELQFFFKLTTDKLTI